MSKLKDLFKKSEKSIYSRFSTKDTAGNGIFPEQLKFSEPFIEKKPNDIKRHTTALDSRTFPIASSAEQIIRITKVLTTPRGVAFLAKQRLLRSQIARPDLRTPAKIGLEEAKLGVEILASLAPPIRGERFASSTFNDQDELYTKSGLTTPLGSIISDKAGESHRLDMMRGMTNISDAINQTDIIDSTDQAEIDRLSALDFIPFYFNDLVNNKTIFFRATLTGIGETISPEWNSERYVGRPFNVYYYGGVERTLGFTFTIYPMNAKELLTNWERYNYLVGLCYPAGYVGAEDFVDIGYIQPPFIQITIGNLYKKHPAILTGLSMSVPDNSGWELGGTRMTKRAQSNKKTNISTFQQLRTAATEQIKKAFNTTTGTYEETDVVDNLNYKLPHIIEVSVGLTLLDRNIKYAKDNLYGFHDPIIEK